MMRINIEKTPFDNVMALITSKQLATLPAALTEEVVYLEQVEDYQEAGENAKLTIVAKQDKGYSGQVTVTYYRPSIEDAFTALPVDEQIEVENTIWDGEEDDDEKYTEYVMHVFDTITQTLQLHPDEVDFVDPTDIPWPRNENTPVQVEMIPKEHSLLYTGGSFFVTFAATDTDIPLDEAILTVNLDGFKNTPSGRALSSRITQPEIGTFAANFD